VGVEGYNRAIMARIFNPRRIFELEGLEFGELFSFVSNSLASLQVSTDGRTNVALPEHLRLVTMGADD